MRNRAATFLFHLAMTAALTAVLAFSGSHIHDALTSKPGILTE